MKALLQKIRAIHKTNKEIADRVEKLEEVVSYSYHADPKHLGTTGQLEIEEVETHVKVQTIINQFRFKDKLRTDVWDVFNDKPDLTCETWHDCKRLNNELLAIVEKFKMLKETERVKNELIKYLHNFEIVQTALGQVEEQTLSEQPRRQRMDPRVTEVNRLLTELKQDGLVFTPGNFQRSTILSKGHIVTLGGWYGTGWSLLYRATTDGWTGQDFHTKCDYKGETITVVYTANGSIFGGYLDKSWMANEGFIQSNKASLFTLVNLHDIEPTRFNLKSANAAYTRYDYGPIFGNGHDIHIASVANRGAASYSAFPGSYRDTTGKGSALFAGAAKFQVAEVEVFGKL